MLFAATIIADKTRMTDERVIPRVQYARIVKKLTFRDRLDADEKTLLSFAKSVRKQDVEMHSIRIVRRTRYNQNRCLRPGQPHWSQPRKDGVYLSLFPNSVGNRSGLVRWLANGFKH